MTGRRRRAGAGWLQAWPALVVLLGSLLVPVTASAQYHRPCTTLRQNLTVRDVMQDLYFWYRSIPAVDPARYDSPEAYLEAIRYRPLDERFSYIAPRAASEAFYGDSQYAGFGFATQTLSAADAPGGLRMRVAQVFPDSPASEARLSRGDDILRINGRTVADLSAGGTLGTALGAAEPGVTRELELQALDGRRYTVTMTKRVVTIPTVSDLRVFEVGGRTTGYLFFRNFVEPSVSALERAFTSLGAARTQELVLDVRYNGGGLVSVARQLASLIGGSRTRGEVFAEFFHNDRNARRNEVMRFETQTAALSLQRVVVITTRASASASELVINALSPFVEVVVVGDRTYGKPVGQYSVPICDKVLYPVAFTLRNARGQGDFFDGIAPTCVAADDLEHAIGDPQEASLAEALRVVATGRCSRAAGTALAGPEGVEEDAGAVPGPFVLPPEGDGFRQLVNAW